MLAKVADAFLLLALTVIIHAAGLTIILRRLPLWKTADDAGFIPRTWLLIQLASWAITIHMVEIAMWGLFFWWKKRRRSAHWHPDVRLVHRLLLHCCQQVVRFALGPKTELK